MYRIGHCLNKQYPVFPLSSFFSVNVVVVFVVVVIVENEKHVNSTMIFCVAAIHCFLFLSFVLFSSRITFVRSNK